MIKKVLVGIMVLLLVALAAVGVLLVGKHRKSSGYEEQLALGNKYLEELDYENAQLCFEKAIEIDEKRSAAYVSLSVVYVRQNRYEEAMQLLDKAQEAVGSQEARNKLQSQREQVQQEEADYLEQQRREQEAEAARKEQEAEAAQRKQEAEAARREQEQQSPEERMYEYAEGELLSQFSIDTDNQAYLGFWHNYGDFPSEEDFSFTWVEGKWEYQEVGMRSRKNFILRFTPTDMGMTIQVTCADGVNFDWKSAQPAAQWSNLEYQRVQ